MGITSSPSLKEFIAQEEGFRAQPYMDAKTGRMAVGYGDTDGDTSKPVSQFEADQRLRGRIGIAESELSRSITRRDLTQGQMDALIDMHYNMGLPRMQEGGFLDLVNSGNDDAVLTEIQKYTKSKNAETGQLEEVEALRKRVAKRASMWSAAKNAMMADNSELLAGLDLDSPQNSDLMAGLDETPADPNADLLQGLDEETTPVDLVAENKFRLAETSDLADPQEAMKNQEARRIAKATGRPVEEALADLVDKTPEQIMTEHKQGLISEYFPAVARWARRDPDNYVTLQKTGDWPRQLEIAGRALNKDKRSDWRKVLDDNAVALEEAKTMVDMVYNRITLDDLKKRLGELDTRRRQNTLTDPGVPKVNEAVSNIGKEGGIWNAITTMAKNPKATALMSMQSAASTVIPFGIALSGLPFGPIGAAAGAGGAFGAGYLLSFTEYMQKQLADFRDPQTGEIDYDRAFSDPSRVQQWRNEADIYGSVMGLSDAFYGFTSGKLFSKVATKGTAAKIAGAAGEAVAEPILEGASQVTASSAADLYAGKLTDEKLQENIQEGQVEALFSVLPGAGMGAVGYGARRVLQTPTQAAIKTVETAAKANQANESLVALSELRAKRTSNPEATDNPEGTKDLIDDIVDSVFGGDDFNLPVDDDLDSAAIRETTQIDSEAVQNSVTIAPSDWIAYHEKKGVDPLEALAKFSPELQQEFMKNRASDSSITLPISDWLQFTEEDPEVEVIARVNGGELNGLEAQEQLDELEANPLLMFDRTVYHGTPHKFDKFKERAIGTGEGAQAYGYGMYFTEDKGVAEWYRKQLTGSGTSYPQSIIDISNKYEMFGFDTTAQAIQAFKSHPDWAQRWDVTDEADIAVIDAYLNERSKPTGQVFEVKLPKGLWVDLDSTIDSVPPELTATVRDSLRQVVKDEPSQSSTWDTVDTSIGKFDVLKAFVKGERLNESYVTFGQILASLSSEEDKALAVRLAASAINGFTYTGLESGKRNFVVFTEDDARIVQKFYDRDPNQPPPQPGQEDQSIGADGPEITIIEPSTAEGNIISRPVELTTQFRTQSEKAVFNSIHNRLKRATKDSLVEPESLDQITEFEFQHLRNRADILGKTLEEVANRLQIGKISKRDYEPGLRGHFRYAGRLSPYVVAFSQEAPTKTVIHEFGHSWLQEMAEDYQFISELDPATMTPAQQEYKYAMDTAAELLGLDNIGNPLMFEAGPERTRVHETFAQTAEKYFLDGEFQESRIAVVMEAFKKWMIKIADIVGMTYPQYPPLKITPQVERMFEGILGISKKIDEEVIPMFPIPLFDPAMLGAEGDRYMKNVYDARSEAIGRAYTKSFLKSERQRERQIESEMAAVRERATTEIDDTPSMKLSRAFALAYQDYQKKRIPEDPRLNYTSVLRILAQGDEARAREIKDKAPLHMIAPMKKGGMDVQQFMFLNGMTDPNQVLELIEEISQRDQLIAIRTAEIIHKEIPLAKTDEEIHKIAVDAVNSRGKEQLLLDELKILATKYLPALKNLGAKAINPAMYVPDAYREVLRGQGRKVVLGALAKKFHADKYLRDSNRMGREAARMFKKSNIEETFDFKNKEALQFFAYLFAKDAQHHMAKARVSIKNFVKYSRAKDFGKTYDADIMSYGRQVIQAVGNRTSIPQFEPERLSEYTGISEPQTEQIRNAVTRFEIISAGRGGEQLTVGDYLSFSELLSTIQSVARKAKIVELAGNQAKLEEVANQIAADTAESDQVVDFTGQRLEKMRNLLRRQFNNPRTIFDGLYKSTEEFAQSALGQLLGTVTDAEAVRTVEFQRLRTKIAEAVRKGLSKDFTLSAITDPLSNRNPFRKIEPIVSDELGFTFQNEGELYMAYLLMGSESGAKKFLLGHGLAHIDVDTGKLVTDKWDRFSQRMIAEGKITEKHFQMFQEIWDTFDQIHPLVKDSMRRSDGFNIGYIGGQTIKTPWGDFRGGYVPVSPTKDFRTAAKIESLLNPDTNFFKAHELYPNMNLGMTNERGEQHYPVNLDMSKITSYLAAATNIAYLRNPMLDFGKVIATGPVRMMLDKRRPGAVENVLVPWYERVAGQSFTDYSPEAMQGLAQKLRKNVNVAMYLFNFMSPLRQMLGLFPAMSKVGGSRVALAAMKAGASPFTLRQAIMEKSPAMASRFRDSQVAMTRTYEFLDMNFDWINWTAEKIQLVTFLPIQIMQNVVDTITWTAAYDKAQAKGMKESAAINYADMMVKSTQSSADVSELSNSQAGDDIKKLFTMVASVGITQHNLLQAEAQRDVATQNKLKAISVIALIGIALPSLIDNVLTEGLAPDKEDEEDEEIKQQKRMQAIALKTAISPLDSVIPLYLRPVTSTILFSNASVSPALSRLKQLESAAKGAKHAYNGVDLTAREAASLMDTFTILTGVPASAIGKGALFLERQKDEDELWDERAERRLQLNELKYEDEEY